MKVKSAIAFLFLSLMMGLPVRLGGQAITSSSESVLEGMPKNLEVRLALSALPPYLRSDATVYVLNPAKGYTAEQKGTNDFTCFVERTDWVRADFRNDLFIPECFDVEGTRTIVPVSFDVARLRAEGKLTPEQLKEEISRKFNDGTYRSPGRPGISYMLSPVQRLYGGPSSKTVRFVNMPHYMFYAPNLTNKELGAGPVMGRYPYLVNSGPHAYLIVNVGETEKARINEEERSLLQDLCAYRAYFCAKEAAMNGPEH